jgi:hypothetical protein
MTSPFPKIYDISYDGIINNKKLNLVEIVVRNARPCFYCGLMPNLLSGSSYDGITRYAIVCQNCHKSDTRKCRIQNKDIFVDTLNYWNFMQWYHDNKPFKNTTPPSKIIIPETYQIKTFFSLSDV